MPARRPAARNEWRLRQPNHRDQDQEAYAQSIEQVVEGNLRGLLRDHPVDADRVTLQFSAHRGDAVADGAVEGVDVLGKI